MFKPCLGLVVLGVCVALSLSPLHAADWNAGRDLATNELSALELSNPNGTVPEWTYGYSSSSVPLILMLYTQHTNQLGSSNDVQGWIYGDAEICANVGTESIAFNWGHGWLKPLAAGEIIMHSLSEGYNVLRWTAPTSGKYEVSAYWRDLDCLGGDGAEGLVLVNGSTAFSQLWLDGGSAELSSMTKTLNAGDTVDFVLANNGSYNYDTTAFNATITAVPEPATIAGLAGLLIAGVIVWWRRRRQPADTPEPEPFFEE